MAVSYSGEENWRPLGRQRHQLGPGQYRILTRRVFWGECIMPDGFPNKPKILRGAFVEYGLSIPPLFVVFQFNPVQLTRNRSLSFSPPNSAQQDYNRALGTG